MDYSCIFRYRGTAAEIVAKFRRKEAENYLIKSLQDEEHSDIAHLLGRIKSKKALPALFKYINEGKDSKRWLAFDSIGKIGGQKAIKWLKGYIHSGLKEYRHLAFEALAQIGTPTVFEFLTKCAKNPYYGDANLAAGSLWWTDNQQGVQKLIRYAKNTRNPYRKSAFRALASIGTESAIDYLIEVLEDENNPDRHRAVGVLNIGKLPENLSIGHRKKLERILIDYTKNKANSERKIAICLLGSIKSKEAVNSLVDCLQEGGEIANWAVCALGEIKAEEATDQLIEYIENEANPLDDKDCAIQALDPKDKRTVPIIIRFIKKNYLFCEFIHSPYKLAEIGTKKAIDFLINFMLDDAYSNAQQHYVAHAFADTPNKKFMRKKISAITKYALDKSKEHREDALSALSKIGGPAEIKVLRGLIDDESVCKFVYSTIYSIHQRLKPQGYNPKVKRLAA